MRDLPELFAWHEFSADVDVLIALKRSQISLPLNGSNTEIGVLKGIHQW